MFHIAPVFSYHEIMRGEGTCLVWPGMTAVANQQWGPPETIILLRESPSALQTEVRGLHTRGDLLVLAIGEARLNLQLVPGGEADEVWYLTAIVQRAAHDPA